MTILTKPLDSGDGHAARRWHGFGDGDEAVRYTEAWEHETFAEQQARWDRSDLGYGRICEQRGEREAARLRFPGLATRNPVRNEPIKLEVE